MENLKFKIIMVVLLGVIFYVATLHAWIAVGLCAIWFVVYLLYMRWKRNTK